MSNPERRHLYLPARDRSFWKSEAGRDMPLLYLAWGYRDFTRQPIPASRHEGWVCVLIEEGSPTLVVRRHEVRMAAGTVAIIGPDCPFGWKGSAGGPAKFLLWMWRALASADAGVSPKAGYATRMLTRAERTPFVRLHDLCRREVLRAAGPESAYLEGCRSLFDVTVQREVLDPRVDAPRVSEVVAVARAWLEAHLDSREPIARLCDYLNMSQSTLYRLFVAEVGVSPLAWFHQARMEKAHALIVAERLSVKETAYALGYAHANDLSRAYRRYFGQPTGSHLASTPFARSGPV